MPLRTQYTGQGGASTGGPQFSDVTNLFKQAISSLTGASSPVEKMYQQGKRKTLSQIAMNMVNSGMANVLNMPAMNLAYENEVRPGVDVQIAEAVAQLLGQQAQTTASAWSSNLGPNLQRDRDTASQLAADRASYANLRGTGTMPSRLKTLGSMYGW